MWNIQTASGRLFSATIEGTRPTLKDTMVATSVYLAHLEESFPDAAQLIACYSAWRVEEDPSRDCYSYNDSDRALQWQHANTAAQGAARRWLSDPEQQTFRFRLNQAAPTAAQPRPAKYDLRAEVRHLTGLTHPASAARSSSRDDGAVARAPAPES